jgi:hypothetical protein
VVVNVGLLVGLSIRWPRQKGMSLSTLMDE